MQCRWPWICSWRTCQNAERAVLCQTCIAWVGSHTHTLVAFESWRCVKCLWLCEMIELDIEKDEIRTRHSGSIWVLVEWPGSPRPVWCAMADAGRLDTVDTAWDANSTGARSEAHHLFPVEESWVWWRSWSGHLVDLSGLCLHLASELSDF